MKELTPKQRAAYVFVAKNMVCVLPTYREIASEFGITVRAAYDLMQALEKKGYLRRTSRGKRDSVAIKIRELS